MGCGIGFEDDMHEKTLVWRDSISHGERERERERTKKSNVGRKGSWIVVENQTKKISRARDTWQKVKVHLLDCRERDCVRLVVSDPKKARKSKIDPLWIHLVLYEMLIQ